MVSVSTTPQAEADLARARWPRPLEQRGDGVGTAVLAGPRACDDKQWRRVRRAKCTVDIVVINQRILIGYQ